MAKIIVWNHPMLAKGTNISTGLEFENGKPRPVTDAQAEILLAKGTNPYIEGSQADVERIRATTGQAQFGTPNPLFGKPLNPEFVLVEDDKPSAPEVKPPAPSTSAAA
jgi:hypothetical protein